MNTTKTTKTTNTTQTPQTTQTTNPEINSNLPYIFILNGSGGCGKNTFVDFIADTYSTRHISIVDPIREYIDRLQLPQSTIDSHLSQKDESTREFMSDLKLALAKLDNIPMNWVLSEVENTPPDTKFLFIDMREWYDIEEFQEHYKSAKTILVVNPNVPEIHSNIADDGVLNCQYDYIIENSGSLDDLRSTAFTFANEVMGTLEKV